MITRFLILETDEDLGFIELGLSLVGEMDFIAVLHVKGDGTYKVLKDKITGELEGSYITEKELRGVVL